MPTERGAEQGDVDGPLECSHDCTLQNSRREPSPGLAHATKQTMKDFKRNKMPLLRDFQPSGPEKLKGADDPLHACPARKTEAQQTSDTTMTETSRIQCCFFPV